MNSKQQQIRRKQRAVKRFVFGFMQDLIAKAATLLEALPYIQRFRRQPFVVKYGCLFRLHAFNASRNSCL